MQSEYDSNAIGKRLHSKCFATYKLSYITDMEQFFSTTGLLSFLHMFHLHEPYFCQNGLFVLKKAINAHFELFLLFYAIFTSFLISQNEYFC